MRYLEFAEICKKQNRKLRLGLQIPLLLLLLLIMIFSVFSSLVWFCVSARLAFTNECLAFDHQRQQKHVEEDEEKFQDAKINLSLSLHSNWAERLWNKLLQRNPTIAKQFSPTHPDNQLAG